MDVSILQKKILYISYDGLTDSLGQSQILPYLNGLSNHGYQFTILSFEKPDRFLKEKNQVESLIAEANISWEPLSFTSKPPMLSKFYDAMRMKQKAKLLQRQHQFDMVHCRSYLAADVGLYLKRKFGVKFLFDMRGFWADEKKDGSWNVANPVFKAIYQYYKNKEAQYLQEADYIISLTEAGKKEMQKWIYYNSKIPVQVIPCCADMDLFSLTNLEQKKAARQKLNIDDNKLVISYLGSIGTWYMLDEMLLFFRQLKEKYVDALFLVITHSPRQLIDKKIFSNGLDPKDFIITQASRKGVPLLIKASDINISFIKPVYSKISSSPTKLGEVLSLGIPVICNDGVGDVRSIMNNVEGGFVLKGFSKQDFQQAIDSIPRLLKMDPRSIRDRARLIFDLNYGIDKYLSVYQKIFSPSQAVSEYRGS